MGSAQSETNVKPEYSGSQISPELKNSHSSTQDKEAKILSEIVDAVKSVRQNSAKHFRAMERLVQLYFELGCEINRNRNITPRLTSGDNDQIIRVTALAISDIAFQIDFFIQEFSSQYLRYGESEWSAEYACILFSGLKFMFELYDPDLELEYDDGNVTFDEIIQSIKDEGNYDGLLEDFEHWFKTECYLERKDSHGTTAKGHWWWE